MIWRANKSRFHSDMKTPSPGIQREPMGKASRDKGARTQRAIVRLLQARGFAAERVPLSGAARGRFSGDISLPLFGIDRRVEVKCRADGFRELYRWLDGAELLVVHADRREPLVVVRMRFATEIAEIAEALCKGKSA
jgi:Holliday junction resolvase